MKYILKKVTITTIIVSLLAVLGFFASPLSPLHGPEQAFGATIPTPVASFTTSLASSINSTDTSMTLVSITTDDGTTLTNGSVYGFTIDEGTSSEEYVTGTVDTATLSVTSMTRGISTITGTTSITALKKAHRRGASVKITDHPVVPVLARILNGNETIPNALTYATGVTPSGGSELADKEYVDSVVNGGTVSYDRITVTGTAGETVAAGNLVYLKTSDGFWWKTDADTASTVENVLLGIAQGAGTASNTITNGVLIYGLDTNQSGMTIGATQYASNTAGAIGSSAGTKEVSLGVARTATGLYFNPRFNQQLTEDEQDAIAGGSTFGTPSSSNKFLTEDYMNSASVVRFGGTGADGALNVTSGTTTINCASANVCVKNYTTINVSAGATLDFSNPASDGTVIVLKATGAVTIAGTIDARGMGGAGGTGGSGSDGADGTAGTAGTGLLSTEAVYGAGGSAGAGTAGVIYTTNKAFYTKSSKQLVTRSTFVYAGNGGGGGEAGDAPDNAAGGNGGRGGGGIIIESRGALNFSGTINTSGSAGSNGSNGTTTSGGGGGGGGGSAGSILVLYNSLTANTGTLTSSGGASGGGGSGSGGDCSSKCSGGGGGGSYTSAGGAGQAATTNGQAPSGAGAGAGGGGGQTTGAATSGASGGATESGLVAQNLYLF